MNASASKTSTTPGKAALESAARKERLAAQLRANLARRKQSAQKAEAPDEQG